MTQPTKPPEQTTAPDEPTTEAEAELRLALAMSGGVSLAVWIGGACAEINRSTRPERPTGGWDELPKKGPIDFWEAMLRISGHRRVVVDVLAGASAGGLNAVLLAAATVSGHDFSEVRNVWLKVANTACLVRRKGRAEQPAWPSLFQGDEYFLPQLAAQLQVLAKPGATGQPARRAVAVRMAATLVEPVIRPVPGAPDEPPINERRYASGFSFNRSRFTFLPDDLPIDETAAADDRNLALQQLALAGRATSSYPAAFEAANVASIRPRSFAKPPERLALDAKPICPNMFGVFHDATAQNDVDRHFVVSDGGILNNLPIGRALAAIADVPADSSTRRELIFLEPSGINPPELVQDELNAAPPKRSLGDRTSTYSVVRGVIGARVPEETIASDVAAIDAYNEAIDRAAAVRAARFGPLANRGIQYLPLDFDAYRVLRAEYDAQLITDLLADPLSVLGVDPFPQRLREGSVAVLDREWRAPLGLWSSSERVRLDADLASHMRDRLSEDTVLTTGALPLIRVTQLLIEWARYLESLESARVQEVSQGKLSLYRVLAFLRAGIDEVRQLGWVAATVAYNAACEQHSSIAAADGGADATDASTEDGRWPRALNLTAMDDWLAGLATTECPAETIKDALQTEERAHDGVLRGVITSCRSRIESTDARGETDLRKCVIDVLIEIAKPLLRATKELPPPISASDPGALLASVLKREEDVEPETLCSLEILCFPEFATAVPGRRPVRFHRLSAGNRTPIAPMFTALFKDAKHDGLWWDTDQKDLQRQQGIHVDLKLAGNTLAHFSSFLLERWRANDWMWGRLDAVPTLVDIFATDQALQRWLEPIDADHRLTRVKALIVRGDSQIVDFESEVWNAQACDSRGSLVPRSTLIAAELKHVDTQSGPHEFPAVRNALIARRQLELVATELPEVLAPPLSDAPTDLSDDEFKSMIKDYDVGAESLSNSGGSDELFDRLAEIADAAGQVAVSNAQVARGSKALSSWDATVVRAISSRGGRALARKATDPAAAAKPVSMKVAAIIGALVVLAVVGLVGFTLNFWAFLCGVAIGLCVVGLPLALAVIILRKRRRRTLAAPPACSESEGP